MDLGGCLGIRLALQPHAFVVVQGVKNRRLPKKPVEAPAREAIALEALTALEASQAPASRKTTVSWQQPTKEKINACTHRWRHEPPWPILTR